ncbi:MAG TPA: hypothetical protein VMF67_11065, partial [Rhizomicrobium sp.]|nr:hypothetical protein [Rhizomicrobium sp.]
ARSQSRVRNVAKVFCSGIARIVQIVTTRLSRLLWLVISYENPAKPYAVPAREKCEKNHI